MLRFVAFGDSGSGLPAQKAIAERINLYHEEHPFEHILLLGDNIYPNGDAIKYGERKFTNLYRPLIEKNVKFMPVLGNHDISGPLGVGFPKLWMSNEDENIRFFNMPGPYYDFVLEDIHFFMINTNRFRRPEREWLIKAMDASTKPWKFVCGHHPVYSSGHHGTNQRLKEKLKPILEKHCAAMYLAGHEHDYERFVPTNGVTYIVSGGGGADMRSFRKPLLGSLVRSSENHFMVFELNQQKLTFKVLNRNGEIIDSDEIMPQSEFYRTMLTHRKKTMGLQYSACAIKALEGAT